MTMRYVNDVTPTTEDIKAAWFYNIGVEPDDIDVDPAVIAGWDNWLASVKAAERERIIALLREEAKNADSDARFGFDAQSLTISWCADFIEGEVSK